MDTWSEPAVIGPVNPRVAFGSSRVGSVRFMPTNLLITANAQIVGLRRIVWAAGRTLYQMAHGLRTRRVPATPHDALRVVAITSGPNSKVALRMAALQEEWHLLFAPSPKDALKLLRSGAVDVLVYDYNSGEEDWRKLCSDCVERGIWFQLVANDPGDALFLSAITAGGLGVLWKPLSSAKLISAMQLARSLAGERLARSGGAPS